MDDNWRATLAKINRDKIVSRIMDTLQRHMPHSGSEEGMNEIFRIAARFEEKIFYVATDQRDYLRKISLKMLNLEARTHNGPNGALLASSNVTAQSSSQPLESSCIDSSLQNKQSGAQIQDTDWTKAPLSTLGIERPHHVDSPALVETVETLSAELVHMRERLHDEVMRRRIAEHRAEHFFQQSRQISRHGGLRTDPYIALYPRPAFEILGRRPFATHAPEIVRESVCSICQLSLDATGIYVLGCGHFFHLYCITHQLVRQGRCPLCRYDVDLATYRVLGMDDLFPGTAEIDPRTGRPVSHTTREDLLAIARESGFTDIPEGFEDPVEIEWTPSEFGPGWFKHVLEENRSTALERVGGAGPSGMAALTEAQCIMSAEELTRVEWEARLHTDFTFWTERQRRLQRARQTEAERALEVVVRRRAPSPPQEAAPEDDSIAR